jgi:hypothetical protein
MVFQRKLLIKTLIHGSSLYASKITRPLNHIWSLITIEIERCKYIIITKPRWQYHVKEHQSSPEHMTVKKIIYKEQILPLNFLFSTGTTG